MMKHTKIILLTVTSMVALFSIEGCTIKSKGQTKQAQTVTSTTTKEDKETIKQKQLAFLKEHEQEIVDLVKAQNSKVESVQIDWDQIQWSDGGITTPEYYINVFGGINHIDDSGWGIDIPINDDQSINLREMFMLHEPTIGGKPIS
ncbi:MAG: hypothetical protein E6Z64_05780 [Streptococcus parasanguinis]|uniref:hypothetical protein n=1 Tax=Streptococcus parasanguinis TaxID=1318 RepID=UPI001D080C60|nr:hypothetical protein [Streptococcus parasanguinis]MCB6479788.1 hypothetical protein [Streptococcus parasanguinis]MCQ5186683.1 hypothetical protein [Streptococcus parasanguinis]MDU2685512.1 hypothetical protein [Streptococcus parasanguinis]MDU5705901.1 hypothetical protein [Streptococcus parasanguinis]MDU5845124.1 hypothetical protein [Streptococcus parasanguinis]